LNDWEELKNTEGSICSPTNVSKCTTKYLTGATLKLFKEI